MNTENQNVLSKHNEFQNCTFIKTILMVIVVLYHSILFWSGDWIWQDQVTIVPLLKYTALWLNSFHVYGFILISGYLFYYLKFEKARYERFLPFLKNKFCRLLVPYVFIVSGWVIPVQIILFQNDWKTIVIKYIMATNPSQLWFLLTLFDIFLIFWPISDYLKNHNVGGTVVCIAAFCFGSLGHLVIPNVFMICSALQSLPFFWIGFKLRQYGTALLRRIPLIPWFLLDLLLFFFYTKLLDANDLPQIALRLGVAFVLHVVGALMVFIFLQKMADKIHWNRQLFAYLSKRSMSIYLIHQQVIYFMILLFNGRINPYLHAFLNFTGTMVISLLATNLLLRFRITRFLIGEK